MGIVFQLKRFFDASFLLVLVTTGLFVALVILLSLRIRKAERSTMFHIGCDRLTIFWIQVAELVTLTVLAAALAWLLSHLAIAMASRLLV